MINPVFKRALQTWGGQAQMLMVVEEMSELTREILKNVNRGKDNVAAIVEETADVEIMLEQLKENYGIAERVAVYKAEKLKQIERRLNELDKKTV